MERYCQHFTTVVTRQNTCWLICLSSGATTTTVATSTALFTLCGSLSFHYVAKMAPIKGEECPAFHPLHFDRYVYTTQVLSVSVNALMHLK